VSKLPIADAARRLIGVVGGEVVALGLGQQRDPDHRDASRVQLPDHARALVAGAGRWFLGEDLAHRRPRGHDVPRGGHGPCWG
jgi:hypothetical protein